METKPSSSLPPAVAPPPTQPPPPSTLDPTVTLPLPSITTATSTTRPHSIYTTTATTTSPPLLPLPPSYAPHPLLGSILGRPPTPALPPAGLVRPGAPPLSSIRTSLGDQMVTVATHAGCIRSTGGGGPIGAAAYPMTQTPMPFGFQSSDPVVNVQQQQKLPLISSRTIPSTQFSGSKPVFVGAVANGMPTYRASPSVLQPKVNSLPTVSLSSDFCNRYKGLREKYRDGSVVMIHDRRVRLVDTSHSLYALCRSWVQNGLPQENQSISGDGARLLPKPLPMSLVNGDSERTDAEEDEGAYEEPEALCARDLLDGHIKRAKRIRTRLKEDRLRRINRYKQRLSLLLPLPVEQDRNSGCPES